MEAAKLELEKFTERKRRREQRSSTPVSCASGLTDREHQPPHRTLWGTLERYTLYNRGGRLLCTSSQWNTRLITTGVQPDGHICYDVIKSGTELLVVSDLQNTDYATKDPNVTRYQLQTYLGHPVKCGGMNMGSVCAVYQTAFVPSDGQKTSGLVAAAIGVGRSADGQSQLVHYAFHDPLTT